MALINSVLVTFVLPDGDDRDHDTTIQIVTKDGTGKVIAQNLNVAPGIKFKDPGTYGPYDVADNVNKSATPQDFEAGTSQVIIIPNTHDRVIWSISITVHWDDGTGRASTSQMVILDQDVNSTQWLNAQGIQLMSKVKALVK